MGTSRTQELLIRLKSFGNYTAPWDIVLPVEPADRLQHHRIRITDQRRVVPVHQNVAAADVVQIRPDQPIPKRAVDLRLGKAVIDAKHTEHDVVCILQRGLKPASPFRITQMIPHHCWVRFKLLHIIKRRFQQRINIFLCHLQGIEQLIMCRNHPAAKEVCLLLMFDHSEQGINSMQPLSKPAELQILNTTRCRYNLDVFYALS